MTKPTYTDLLDRIADDAARIRALGAHLRKADDIEHSISAEDWYKERDALLATSETVSNDRGDEIKHTPAGGAVNPAIECSCHRRLIPPCPVHGTQSDRASETKGEPNVD